MLFVPPALPRLQAVPPVGDQWQHEIKFDGWRVQICKLGDRGALYSKRGIDISYRFREIARLVPRIAAKSVIIDGELVAAGPDGMPSFDMLRGAAAHLRSLCVWAFDLLEMDGEDVRGLPLSERQKRLGRVVRLTDDPRLRLSEPFSDAEKLLAEADRLGLEGIVSKMRDKPYRSGTRGDWVKVKCATWRELNRDRGKLFRK